MLKVAMLALGASLSISAIAPQDAAAQLSGRTRSGQTIPTDRRGDVITHGTRNDDRCFDNRRDRDDDRYDRDDDDRDDRGRNPKKDGRHDNGKHKGWYKNGKADDCDLNRSNRNRSIGMSDVILRRPRYSGQTLNHSVLQQVLGNSALSRIDQARYQLGYNGPLTGRWYEGSGGSQLDLYANGLQIVQILDRNRDGRVDVARWTNAR
ncbi:MAG TPA: hypothetical protein VM100_05190 [Longimicrobiales bacterium]|nr:hypothetical protein [Longimicrobiales bacterium]